MPDPGSIAAGLSSLKAALDITKTLAEARDTARLLAVKLELQQLLLDAQEAQATLAAEKRDLEEKVRALESWDVEKAGYHLKDMGNGCMAYAPDPPVEPGHALCANCFHQGRKSILTPFHISAGRADALRCHACNAEMVIRGVDLRDGNRRWPPTNARA